jgi:hypothetical protein
VRKKEMPLWSGTMGHHNFIMGVEELLWYLEKVCDEGLKLEAVWVMGYGGSGCGVLHLREANQRWQTNRGGHDQAGESRFVLC